MKKRAKKKAVKRGAKKKVARRGAKKKAAKKRARKSPRRAAARPAPKRPRKPRKPKHPKKPSPPKPRKPKKPHKPAPGRPVKPKGVKDTVVLSQPAGPDHVPVLSVSRKDKLRWVNEDTISHTLTFTIWPFEEPDHPIVIPAGAMSSWFMARPGTLPSLYDYDIDPAFPDQGPPDPPQVEYGP